MVLQLLDVTSHDLITGIITEKGILQGDYAVEIASLFEKTSYINMH
ncbi:hypothetical protein [Bacillus pseudomycoides]|nr:hypothetical protein [Bacillus pseudomycoides]